MGNKLLAPAGLVFGHGTIKVPKGRRIKVAPPHPLTHAGRGLAALLNRETHGPCYAWLDNDLLGDMIILNARQRIAVYRAVRRYEAECKLRYIRFSRRRYPECHHALASLFDTL